MNFLLLLLIILYGSIIYLLFTNNLILPDIEFIALTPKILI